MTSEEKINEAKFFLEKIIENYTQSPFLEYYFNAFVTSTRSISDYLLEDYNQKFNLGIPDNERKFHEMFKEKAYQLGGQAVEFHKWHDRQITKITSNMYGKTFWNKRNFIIHRDGEKLDNISQMIVGNDFPKDKAIAIQKNYDQPLQFFPTTVIWIEDFGYVDLKEACEHFISLMREMVSEAHRTYFLINPDS